MEYVTHHDKVIGFDTGAIRSDSAGKGRFDLISPVMLRRLAGVYERGAKQKGDRNWEGGFPMSRALDSALRHINQYREGYRDEDHLAQAIWNIAAAIHFEELRPEFNDLPSYVADVPALLPDTTNAPGKIRWSDIPVYDINTGKMGDLSSGTVMPLEELRERLNLR